MSFVLNISQKSLNAHLNLIIQRHLSCFKNPFCFSRIFVHLSFCWICITDLDWNLQNPEPLLINVVTLMLHLWPHREELTWFGIISSCRRRLPLYSWNIYYLADVKLLCNMNVAQVTFGRDWLQGSGNVSLWCEKRKPWLEKCHGHPKAGVFIRPMAKKSYSL